MKKTPPKPLFPLKHEFVDSLDAYIQASTAMAQAVGMLIRAGDIKGPMADVLKERLAAFESARSI